MRTVSPNKKEEKKIKTMNLNQVNDRIFLSYASEDRKKVIDYYNQFREEGLNPWMDKYDLMPGQLWDKEIKTALRKLPFYCNFLFDEISNEERIHSERI